MTTTRETDDYYTRWQQTLIERDQARADYKYVRGAMRIIRDELDEARADVRALLNKMIHITCDAKGCRASAPKHVCDCPVGRIAIKYEKEVK